jgi:hypothetical protein
LRFPNNLNIIEQVLILYQLSQFFKAHMLVPTWGTQIVVLGKTANYLQVVPRSYINCNRTKATGQAF